LKNQTRKLGAHVSTAGGVDKAIERAAKIGANCMQIFSGSPRVWQRPNLDLIDAHKICATQQQLAVELIFTHALYLVNLASENPDLVKKSTNALAFDLRFDSKIKGAGVVVHLGSHMGRGWEAIKEQVLRQISSLINDAPHDSHFLIENSAGQNGKIGSDLAEIKWLINELKSKQVGWCLDSCHAFASGYHLGDPKQQPMLKDNPKQKNLRVHDIFAEIKNLDLAPSLKLIHLNDSRDIFGSGADRHQNIGEGFIPPADLCYFLHHNLFVDVPLILEVPGMDGKSGPDAENINRVKKILE